MKKSRVTVITLITFVLLLALVPVSACSPPATPAAPAPAPPPAPAPAPPPAAPKPSPTPPPPVVPSPSGQPKSGGVFRVVIEGAPTGWDPQRPGLAFVPGHTTPVFNNLVQFDPTKQELTPENIVGDLAEKWDTSADGKTYTFFLRKGVKWHDGRPFTARDVVANLDKLASRATSLVALQLPAYQKSEAVDDYTVRVHLSRPQPSMLGILATSMSVMVPTYLTVDYRSTDWLVGTGPFKFKKYDTGSSLELVRNPDYFGKDAAGNRLPYLDGYRLEVVADSSARLNAFVTKRVDMMPPSVGLFYKEDEDRLALQAPQTVTTWFVMAPLLYYFNVKRKPLDDVRVRQALALAAEVEPAAVGGFGAAKFRDFNVWLLTQPWGVSRAEQLRILGWDKPLDERIAKAKTLLAEAGYASGLKLTFVTLNMGMFMTIPTIAIDQWRKIGVDVNMVSLPMGELLQRLLAGDFDITMQAPKSQVGDPDEAGSDFSTGSPNNYGKYSNPEYDKLVAQQSTTLDVKERAKLTQRMERILLTEVPFISLGGARYATAYWPWVKGFVHHNASQTTFLRMERVWLDENLRK